MREYDKNATLKTTWTNAVIGAALMVLAGAGARFGVWYGVMWQGDPEIYWTEFAVLSVEMLMLSLLLPVITYLLSYGRYKTLAAHHPADLRGVARGVYGRPSLKLGFLLVVLEALALAVIALGIKFHFKMDMNFDADRIAFVTLLAIGGGGALLDLILYSFAIRFLKPDKVQRS